MFHFAYHLRNLISTKYSITVKALLEAGVSPDSTNEDGLTALHQVDHSISHENYISYAKFRARKYF